MSCLLMFCHFQAHGELTQEVHTSPVADSPVSNQPSSLPQGSERKSRIADLPSLLGVSNELALDDKQSPNPLTPLSLERAIKLGVANNFSVRAALEHQESFKQTSRAAMGALLPRIDARVASGTGQLESVTPAQPHVRQESSVVLHQVLFDLPAYTEYKRQKVLTSESNLQLQAKVSTAALEVSSAYFQALQSRLIIDLSADYEKALGELLAYMTDRESLGGTSVAERDRVRARVANARSQMADARANLHVAVRNLKVLIDEEPGTLLFSLPSFMKIPSLQKEAQSESIEANRDILATRRDAEAIALEERQQKAKYLPVFGVDVTHSQSNNAAGSVSYLNDNKVMLVMNWNLLNGGTDKAQSLSAAARMREKNYTADDMQRKLNQDLENAYADLDSVNERFESIREELSANQTVASAFRAQLGGDKRQLLDVLDAYQRLHQSKIDLVQLVIGEVQNHIKVADLTGRLSILANDAALYQTASESRRD